MRQRLYKQLFDEELDRLRKENGVVTDRGFFFVGGYTRKDLRRDARDAARGRMRSL